MMAGVMEQWKVNGWMGELMEAWKDGWVEKWKNGRLDEWTIGRIEGLMGGLM